MVDIISSQNSLVSAALYYIRLDAHSSALFQDKAVSATSFAQVAADELLAAATHKGIVLNQWAVAPDAIHAVVCISENRLDQNDRIGKPRQLTYFVAGVKAATAKRINLMRNEPGCPVWKRSYREQRIEDDRTLSRLTAQIQTAQSVKASS